MRDVDRAVTFLDEHVCGVVPGNKLGAEGMAALAPALGNLVSLTSLDLQGTWPAICYHIASRRREWQALWRGVPYSGLLSCCVLLCVAVCGEVQTTTLTQRAWQR